MRLNETSNVFKCGLSLLQRQRQRLKDMAHVFPDFDLHRDTGFMGTRRGTG